MIIADMLIRCDYPHYKAVRFENGQRVSWPSEDAARASCEAIRLPPYFNQRESFRYFEIAEISLLDFWDACDRADWFTGYSDDQNVWRRGGGIGKLEGQSLLSGKHRKIYEGFRAHACGTERSPKPDRPDAQAIEARRAETQSGSVHESAGMKPYGPTHPDYPNAPSDWDGGPYLCRDGGLYHMRGYGWAHGLGCWSPTADWDRVAYVAQAIEARRAETAGLGAKHESAVGNADAPEVSPETGSPDHG